MIVISSTSSSSTRRVLTSSIVYCLAVNNITISISVIIIPPKTNFMNLKYIYAPIARGGYWLLESSLVAYFSFYFYWIASTSVYFGPDSSRGAVAMLSSTLLVYRASTTTSTTCNQY